MSEQIIYTFRNENGMDEAIFILTIQQQHLIQISFQKYVWE